MSTTNTPTTHAELVDFANETYSNLITKYENDGQAFVDIKDDTGIIYRCAGSISLLLLINNFDIEEKDKATEIVLKEFAEVIKHIAEKGYDATPLVAERATTNLFSVSASPRYYYTDTLSWVLSFAIQIRLSDRLKKIDIGETVRNETVRVIQEVLGLICDSACEKGGWNFSNDCTEPDLYYSFAVSEALADLGDYVQGETPEIFGETSSEAAKDIELLDILGPDLISKVEARRKNTAKWLVDNFLKSLGSSQIAPVNKKVPTGESDHNRLYYTFFVIDMLIICNADKHFKNKQVNKYIEHGIYLSRIDYDKASADAGWFNDPVASSLSLTWENHADPSAPLPQATRLVELREPALVPLSLRCNALYAYYIAEGADRKMSNLFDELFNNREKSSGLWDTWEYNLMVTERAIEAIVDYSDYLLRFETTKSEPIQVEPKESKVDAGFRALVHECIEDYFSANEQLRSSKAVPRGKSEKTNGSINEAEMLEILTSAFSTGEKLMKGHENPTYMLDKATFEQFCRGFNKFLVTWLCSEMQTASTEDPEKLRRATRKNVDNLLARLPVFLNSDMTITAGEMFQHLLDETVKNDARNN